MATLYRKYRPQTFEEAVGQNHIKVTLQNEIQTDSIAHAYLFCGPRAVGKTTFSRLIAKSLNCTNRKENEFEPCNKCDACLEVIKNKSLDVIEIDAASNTGVDNVRDNIISSARIATSKNKYKVFIIDEVHMLSISAFNALLKVLEEPPKNVIFILCTTEMHKVPATIISRCQRFDFRRISISDVVKKLKHIVTEEKIKVEDSVLEAVARQSEGHMRDAESLLGQVISIAGKEITQEEADLIIPRSDIGEIVNLIELLSNKDTSKAISLINKILNDGINLDKFVTDFIEVSRKLMLSKINSSLGDKLGVDVGESFEMKLNEIKEKLEIEKLVAIIERFLKAKKEIKSSFITQLPLELAITELCLITNAPVQKVYTAGNTNNQAIKNTTTVNNNKQETPTVSAKETPNVSGVNPNSTVNKTQIEEKWSEFLAKIKQYNHSLSFVLRVSKPGDINGNTLTLLFKYKFHKDRISELKIKELVQNTLREVYGAPLEIESVIDENLQLDVDSSPIDTSPAGLEKAEAQNTPPPPTQEMPPSTPTPTPTPTTPPVAEKQEEKPAEEAPTPETPSMMDGLMQNFGGKIVG